MNWLAQSSLFYFKRVFILMVSLVRKLCFLLLVFSQLVHAENITSQVQPLAEKSLLLDIHKIGESKLIAVGERGHVLISRDGNTWQQISVPSVATLTRAFFLNDKLGWIVGHDATILQYPRWR